MTTPIIAIPRRWGNAVRSVPVAAGMAAAIAAAFARLGSSPHAFVIAFLLAVLVVLAVIDVDRRIIPNAIVLPATALVLSVQLTFYPGHATEWVVAALGAAAVLLVFFVINPNGMGMGDVKLALLLGAALGHHVAAALVIASLSVWPFGIHLLAKHGAAARKAALPFGPFLAFGAAVVALLA